MQPSTVSSEYNHWQHRKGGDTPPALRALSSVGRASGLQPEGRGFKSPSVHHHPLSQTIGSVALTQETDAIQTKGFNTKYILINNHAELSIS